MNARMNLLGALALAGLTASSASAQITGSGHDFSSMAWSGGQICKPCHTPHNAIAGMPRLWNHELTTATYTMHEGTGTAEDDFDYRSRMCLSCHDGTVALDSFGGTTGSSYIPSGANLGTDLTNDHPVGSDALYPPIPQPTWWANSFKASTALPSAIRLQDWTDSAGTAYKVVGCTSCHNPHNRGNYGHMLVMSNAASAVCLGCHIK
jgi:predicted CXXCH cytochrome family protein